MSKFFDESGKFKLTQNDLDAEIAKALNISLEEYYYLIKDTVMVSSCLDLLADEEILNGYESARHQPKGILPDE